MPHFATSTPARAAAEREQHALGQRLPGEAQAAGAERRAYRHLALARRRFGEQQVGHVDARDEQHEGDRAEKGQEAVTHRRLELVAQRRHVRAVVAVGLGILLLKLRADPIHLRARAFERHAGLQPRVDAQKVIDARRRLRSAFERERAQSVSSVFGNSKVDGRTPTTS